MADVEKIQEATMWVVVLAAGILAATRFVAYIDTVQTTNVHPTTAIAWWATYAIAVGLVVVGLLGQRTTTRASDSPAWLALLVGILVLVLMPTTPAGAAALGMAVPLVGLA